MFGIQDSENKGAFNEWKAIGELDAYYEKYGDENEELSKSMKDELRKLSLEEFDYIAKATKCYAEVLGRSEEEIFKKLKEMAKNAEDATWIFYKVDTTLTNIVEDEKIKNPNWKETKIKALKEKCGDPDKIAKTLGEFLENNKDLKDEIDLRLGKDTKEGDNEITESEERKKDKDKVGGVNNTDGDGTGGDGTDGDGTGGDGGTNDKTKGATTTLMNSSKQIDKKFKITGEVIIEDNGKPLGKVIFRIGSNMYSTDKDGKFEIPGIVLKDKNNVKLTPKKMSWAFKPKSKSVEPGDKNITIYALKEAKGEKRKGVKWVMNWYKDKFKKNPLGTIAVTLVGIGALAFGGAFLATGSVGISAALGTFTALPGAVLGGVSKLINPGKKLNNRRKRKKRNRRKRKKDEKIRKKSKNEQGPWPM